METSGFNCAPFLTLSPLYSGLSRNSQVQKMQQQNISGLLRSLKTISGFKEPLTQSEEDLQWVHDLNLHFNRFDQSPSPPSTQLHVLTWTPGQRPAPSALHTSDSAHTEDLSAGEKEKTQVNF